MEQLRTLKRKSAVLLALGQATAQGSEAVDLADTLIALVDAFGRDELPRRVRLLSNAVAELPAGALEKAAAAAAEAATVAPEQDATEEDCRVALEGLELAQSALEDFVCSYFMFHGLSADSPSDVLRYLPALSFVEGHIYDLDQANEDSLLPEATADVRKRPRPPGEDPFGPLRAVLRSRGWLTPRMETELISGGRFWMLERSLCSSLATALKPAFQRAEVEEALRLKSFDYRVMNLLLYSMRRAEPNENHLSFLAASEVLVEIGDDLADYAEDVERNSFNVYRCFLALYGHEDGPRELMKFIGDAEAGYAAALARLDSQSAASWKARCEAVKRHGSGSERGPGGGNWELPDPIDEGELRSSLKRPN
eukprot:gnl/TRDRNA2_/TRDRNA2_38623_c0_seq1.p1 gnl/TRDRNA2_/TRDRNA2_38623_c0~~gnl/TRDRNA2_/TRDRNA2_38623_c0_seq1.p1  ORF type:complete len:367 (+),score=72.52 gnl/TRDRNA2_/TRDRNA2_38623_c0_seq1:51-1151(+)